MSLSILSSLIEDSTRGDLGASLGLVFSAKVDLSRGLEALHLLLLLPPPCSPFTFGPSCNGYRSLPIKALNSNIHLFILDTSISTK